VSGRCQAKAHSAMLNFRSLVPHAHTHHARGRLDGAGWMVQAGWRCQEKLYRMQQLRSGGGKWDST